MRKYALLLIALLMLPVYASAQQTFASRQANNNFTGQNTLAGVKIEWSNAVTYQALQVVSYMGSLYQSIAGGNLNHTPTDTMYWTEISGTGDGGGSTASVIYKQTGGSDAADGLGWGTAKLTIGAAFTACPTNCVVVTTGDQTLSSDPFVGVTTKNITLNILSGTLTASVDLSIPKNFSIRVENGGQIAVATTRTVVINGTFDAGQYRVFTLTGTGKANPFNPANGSLTPKWWGAVGDDDLACSGGTDDTVAIQAAATAMEATGGHLKFPVGLFRISDEIDLSIGASQRISGSTPPSVGPQRSGICAHTDGYIFNKPAVDTTGYSYILEDMYLKNTHATGGCAMIGTSQIPSRISGNLCDAFRGFITSSPAGTGGSFGLTIENNQVSCTSTSNPLAIGVYVGQYTAATNNSINACYIGLATGGTGVFIGGTRVETNKWGIVTGIGADGATGAQSSGLVISGARGEANDVFAIINRVFGSTIQGLSNQGSTNAPSGQSITGVWIADAAHTTFSGLDIAGTNSAQGCLVDAGTKDNVIIETANCSGGGLGSNWTVSYTGAEVSYNNTNAPNNFAQTGPDPYDATTWNANNSIPTKNDIRDKIETMSGGGSPGGASGDVQTNDGSGGFDGGTALASLANVGALEIQASNAPYNIVADAMHVVDGVCAYMTAVCTSATAHWLTNATVGQAIYGVNGGLGGVSGTGVLAFMGTIVTIDSDTQVTVSQVSLCNVASPCTNLDIAWGTRQEAAMTQFFDDITDLAQSRPITAILPSGGILWESQWFNDLITYKPAIMSAGRTVLYPTPDFAFGAGGQITLANPTIGTLFDYRDFEINGLGLTTTDGRTAVFQGVSNSSGVFIGEGYFYNFNIHDWGNGVANWRCATIDNYSRIYNFNCINAGAVAIQGSFETDPIEIFGGKISTSITSGPSVTIDSPLVTHGVVFTGYRPQVDNGTVWHSFGDTFLGGVVQSLNVKNGTAWITGCIAPGTAVGFGGSAYDTFITETSGILHVRDCKITAPSGKKAFNSVTDGGTIYDHGGNSVLGAGTYGDAKWTAEPFCADAGANDTYACTTAPAIGGYITGVHYRFKANTANTGAATVNFNALGAKTIKKAAGGITTDLADNDIRAGQWVDLIYDGTNMQMQSALGNATAGGGTPTVITVADTTDTTSFCGLFESATGDLGPKTDAGCTYDAAAGRLTTTGQITNGSNLTTADVFNTGIPGNTANVYSNHQVYSRPVSTFGTYNVAANQSSYMEPLTGGTFTSSNKTTYSPYMATLRGRAYGQHTGYNTSVEGYGLGDAFASGGNVACWGGGYVSGTSQPLCGITEINVGEGNTTFSALVNGTPGASATSIPYDTEANESVLGSRFLLNLTRATVAGTVASISGTTVTTSSGPNWLGGAAVCNITGAATNCDPTGQYFKVNSSDVTINSVSIGHWYKITAVINTTSFTIENAYDTTDLATTGAYTIVQGSEVQSFDTTAKTLTIAANGYTWSNNDSLQSPPNHQVNIRGFNILFNHLFKTRGPTTANRAFTITANGYPMDTAFYLDGAGGWNTGFYFGSPLGTGIHFGTLITGKGMFFDQTCNAGCNTATTQMLGRNGGANSGTFSFGAGDTINWATGASDTVLAMDATSKNLTVSIAGAAARELALVGAQYSGEFMTIAGYKSGPGLDTTTDDEDDVFINKTGVTVTITSIFCRSDAGTPTVNLLRNDGSAANIMTSDITCSTSGATSTTFTSGENVIANGEAVNLNVTAASTAKRATLAVTYTKAIN